MLSLAKQESNGPLGVTPKEWQRTAGWELRAQRPGRVKGQVEISMALGRPDNRKRDLDNAATKAALDLLVEYQVISCDTRW